MRRIVLASLLAPLALAGAATAATERPIDAEEAAAICGAQHGDVTCGPGKGRRTAGGGEKVSHKGWPAITGIFWKVDDSRDRTQSGGAANDELLGHHGSERLYGRAGKDVLWGDWDPHNNNGRQRDLLDGGPGDDWIYPGHGVTRVKAGAGRDFVWAFYGRGTIDCGPGRDTIRIRMGGAFKHRNCEIVRNFCAFGSKPGGGCYKPGEKPRTRR